MEPIEPYNAGELPAGWQPVIYAKNQPQYRPLPAVYSTAGEIVTCWKLTWNERISLLVTGRLFLTALTFHNPLQPILPAVERPILSAPVSDGD